MSLPKSDPAKGGKKGGLWQGSSRRAIRKPLEKTSISFKQLGGHISKHTTPIMTTKDPTTSPKPSGRWPCPFASWTLMSMRSRRHGLDERTSGLLTAWQKVPQRTSISSGWCLTIITQDHGLKGNPFHQGPDVVRCSVLPVVQEGQNEGMVVNHLHTSHYHPSLICS